MHILEPLEYAMEHNTSFMLIQLLIPGLYKFVKTGTANVIRDLDPKLSGVKDSALLDKAFVVKLGRRKAHS
jgi:hypothetical protein